jgi:phosphotransferase system IIB component
MYSLQTDRLERRRRRMFYIVTTLMSLFSGCLLPLELSLFLLCPLLFFFHVAYMGVLFAVFQSMHIYLGFFYHGVSTMTAMPGTLLEFLSYLQNMSLQNSLIRIVTVGLISFFIYFFMTRLYFKYLALDLFHTGVKDDVIKGTIESVGGVENIKLIHSGTERLVISLYDAQKLDVNRLKELGAIRVTETKAGYAKSMVTGFIQLGGTTVGVIGNQAGEHGNVLHADGCDKAAAFVKFCDAYEIPVLTLTNIEGYCTCKCAERRLPRALAALTNAFASATVAKINLITGSACGSSYVLMNSKSMGADLVYAFPDAKVEIMNPSLAANIMGADANEFATKVNGLNNAARHGYVDRIVNFEDTRKYLIDGFEMLYTKKTFESYKKHSTK